MNDAEQLIADQAASQEVDRTPPPADPSQVLSPRRRSALVTYLSILFAVAFLFVALMMVIETKRLKTMNQELRDTNQKNNASLTSNINALQEENQQLSKDNEALNEQIAALTSDAETARTENQNLQNRIEQLTEEKSALNAENQTLKDRIDELTQEAEDAVTVSELLHKAIAADGEGDMNGLRKLLAQIEPMQRLLSPSEAELYEHLQID